MRLYRVIVYNKDHVARTAWEGFDRTKANEIFDSLPGINRILITTQAIKWLKRPIRSADGN